MKDKYTLEHLTALPDAELDRLAAEVVMGWTFMKHQRWTPADYWVDGDLEERCKATEWHPTTNRNQSGELLKKMESQRWTFDVGFGAGNRLIRCIIDDGVINADFKIPGNSPRSETIAAILAAQAMEEGR